MTTPTPIVRRHLALDPTATEPPAVTGYEDGDPFVTANGEVFVLRQGAWAPAGGTGGGGAQRVDLQILLPGTAVVVANAAPPGLYVHQRFRVEYMRVRVGTAPSGGPGLNVVIEDDSQGSNPTLANVLLAPGESYGELVVASNVNAYVAAGGYLRVRITDVGTTAPGADISVALGGTVVAAPAPVDSGFNGS